MIAWPPSSPAADQPAGMTICSGPFQMDGQRVTNTATVFTGSMIDSAASVCTIRTSGGATISLDRQSAVTMLETGATLTHGTVRIKGRSDLGLPGAKVVIRPLSDQTVIQARIADDQFLVNVSTGSATLAGPKSEQYATLNTGTLMRLAPAPNEPTGVYIWVAGCLHSKGDSWYVNDQHFDGSVELAGDTVRRELRPVRIWGAPQQPGAGSSQPAVLLRVIQETTEDRPCPAFTPTSSLGGGEPLKDKETAIVIGAVAAGAAGIALATIPGQNQTSASVP